MHDLIVLNTVFELVSSFFYFNCIYTRIGQYLHAIVGSI